MQSEQIGKLAEALSKAQALIKPPKKGRIGKIKGTNKEGKPYEYEYNYADLADVIESYRKPLSDNGLAPTQTMRVENGHFVLVTSLLHTSGEWLSSEYPIPTYAKAQEQGSAITYARRYAVTALLGIAAEDDDDGAAANEATPAKRPEAKKSEPPRVPLVTREQVLEIHEAAKRAGVDTLDKLKETLSNICGVHKATEIPAAEFKNVLEAYRLMAEHRDAPAPDYAI